MGAPSDLLKAIYDFNAKDLISNDPAERNEKDESYPKEIDENNWRDERWLGNKKSVWTSWTETDIS